MIMEDDPAPASGYAATGTGAPSWTERMAASAMARAARASWPVTRGVVLSRTQAVNSASSAT